MLKYSGSQTTGQVSSSLAETPRPDIGTRVELHCFGTQTYNFSLP